MNRRERVLAAMARLPVDYVPCVPSFNELTPAQRVRRRWQFPWGSSMLERVTYLVEELDVDPVVPAPVPRYSSDHRVSSRVWLEGETLHKVISTPSGDLHAAIRYDERWPFGADIPLGHDFIGHHAKFWLETPRDLEALRHVIRPPEMPQDVGNLGAIAEWKVLTEKYELATIAGIGMGLTLAQQLCGATQLCLMTVDQPELIRGFLELEHQATMRGIEIAHELGVDIIMRNGFYETADLYSPAMLERFLGDLLRAEIDAVNRGDGLISYTVHTGVMPILDYLAKLDFDCLFGIDIAFKGVDLRVIKSKLSDRKSFWTGPSNTYHMWSEDPGVVRQAVRDAFAAFGKTGLLITACPSAHSIMPWDNTLAMVDEWRKLR